MNVEDTLIVLNFLTLVIAGIFLLVRRKDKRIDIIVEMYFKRKAGTVYFYAVLLQFILNDFIAILLKLCME